MTNKEALVKGVLAGLSVDDFQANKALLDAGVDGTADYSPSNEKSIDTCAVSILHNQYLSSVSEGGYSVSFDRQAIEKKIGQLTTKWGLDNPLTPTVKSRAAW